MFKTTTAEDHVLVSSELEGEREGEGERERCERKSIKIFRFAGLLKLNYMKFTKS